MYIIDELRKRVPAERVTLIQDLYEKNCQYFTVYQPKIMEAIGRVHCPYQIQLTTDFLTLTDDVTNELCVEAKLDVFAEQLGDLVHDGWVEYENLEAKFGHNDFPLHRVLIANLNEGLTKAFPPWQVRYNDGQVFLQDSRFETKNSPPVIFLGVFHGLQIARYLQLADPARVMLIEPDVTRFEVSLYFLDYQELFESIPYFDIILGTNVEEGLKAFMPANGITPIVWLRLLPAYSSEHLEPIAKTILHWQHGCLRTSVSIDSEFSALQAEEQNIFEKLKVLTTEPDLSDNVQIAIVGPGTSLQSNLDWLIENREKLIIFSVHSSVIQLKKAGITPDFQFARETAESQQIIKIIPFDEATPLMLAINASGELIRKVREPLLVPLQGEITSLDYIHRITCTPATENFAVAVALYYKPKRIFLVGIDCAEKALENSEEGAVLESNEELVEVRQNLDDSQGKVRASHHNNRVRIGIENKLGERANLAVEVYNLSNGAFITGALPVCADKLSIPEYKEKNSDILKIMQSFEPAEKGRNWNLYDQSGKSVLRVFIHTILKELYMDEYNWTDFSHTMDEVISRVQQGLRSETISSDMRVKCFTGIVTDLLRGWYKCMTFCHNDIEGEIVYRNGLVLLENILEEMEWPERKMDTTIG